MARLTRVQQQERTRVSVLAAAREEFTRHGYTEARIDRIAERAELTRGAVYSNFPGKRALYLAVLLDLVERGAGGGSPAAAVRSPAEALGALARVWLERLPLTGDAPGVGHLQLRSLTGVVDDEPARTALTNLARLEALLLALALESVPGGGPTRQVRLAELVLTLFDGSGHLAETAPGFGDPFDLARACEHLAGIDLEDTWDPPHLPYVRPADTSRDTWGPPGGLLDQLTGEPVDLDLDGVVAVLGTARLGAVEDAVRAARPADQVTVVVVTGDPAEIGRLVRLRIGDLAGCLRRVFAPGSWAGLRVVVDDRALTASALGLTTADDGTETAVRVRDGVLVARADGRGAPYAAAVAGAGAAGSDGR
ncbi:MAG: TetR/AcrR family transcriptional regulator [Pseudonocardia sp.]|nr:TetR/AcrR family transcriptional regulator [Pseudonocardia sp.]